MINTRTLELVKAPELLKESDVELLKREISNYPYIQSIRALYLLALHQFSLQEYDRELSLTAAYTTDKKILYSLVNPNPKTPETQEIREEEIQEHAAAPITKESDTPKTAKMVGTKPTQKEEAAPDDSEIDVNENENLSRTSFTSTDSFLPSVNFSISKKHHQYVGSKSPKKVPSSNFQYENKPKEQPKVETPREAEDEDFVSDEINFSPQHFEEPKKNDAPTTQPTENAEWKAIQIEAPLPDALIGAKEEDKTDSKAKKKSLQEEEKQTSSEDKMEDVTTKQPTQVTSNVPSFINTWQNWLHKGQPEKSESNLINDTIDKFLRENPKIKGSKEKSPVPLKVQEKEADISHLMTETLANLYVMQKSYDKALEAYHILIEKHPEKSNYFQEKIKSIQEAQK